MKTIRLLGYGMAMIFDVSVGMLITLLASEAFGANLSIQNCLIGGMLSIAPDVDILYMFIRKGKVYTDHHQFITHRPVFGITIAVLIGWVGGGINWSITATACVFWHYLHDTYGFGGGGIAWLWPFSKYYLSARGKMIKPKDSAMNCDPEVWLHSRVLSPNKQPCIEFSLSAILLGIVGSMIFGQTIGIVIVFAIIGFVLGMWYAKACLLRQRQYNQKFFDI